MFPRSYNFVRFITQVCSSFESGSRMNPPRWERLIRRGMRYMNIHLYAAQVYCNSWPHISDFIKVENSQVWRKFPGYGCEYQIIEIEAPWGLDCCDTKIIFRCCSYLTFERSRGWPFWFSVTLNFYSKTAMVHFPLHCIQQIKRHDW